MGTQYAQILVDGDPTIWTLKNPISDPAEITGSSAPLALDVIRPVNGILLLSVKAAAFVTLYPAPGSGNPMKQSVAGWITGPWAQSLSSASSQSFFLYLPSVSVLATDSVLHQVPAATSAAKLQETITTAMSSSQRASVPFEVAGSTGQVVVNGAVLPFAVIVTPRISLPPEG